MSAQKTKVRKVTIDYSSDNLGIQELEAQILLHLHDVDGSQLIVLRTPKRKSVNNFIHKEVVNTEKTKPILVK